MLYCRYNALHFIVVSLLKRDHIVKDSSDHIMILTIFSLLVGAILTGREHLRASDCMYITPNP